MFSEASSTAERSSSCQSFTISQVAPSALLQFEPPLHSKELAEAIHNYVPGPFTLQEKQRQVSMEFFQWRSTNCPDGPASYFHDAAPAMEFSNFSSAESSFDYSMASSSGQTSFGNNTKSSAPARRTKSKVVKKSSAKPVSSGPRLPGLSIMTKDGVDITDLAPRGPKTKEQRDHAAMMRKLKACPTCKKRKQRCNPSHHTQVSPSSSSAKISSPGSSGMQSQAPTPASSAASPYQRHSQEVQISQAGQHFNGAMPSKTALTPSDFSPASAFETPATNPFALESADFGMGMDIVDPSLFDFSMPSTGFEPNADDYIDGSLLDFINWDVHQGSDLLATNVSSQGSNFASSALLPSSSHTSTHTPPTPALLTGSHFNDFVPAWDTGSTPFIPLHGSPLPSPEEFGFQTDISRALSGNSQMGNPSLLGSTGQQSNAQHDSLFGDYSPSSFYSDMMTPATMSATSSSQGVPPNGRGSLPMVTQELFDQGLVTTQRNVQMTPALSSLPTGTVSSNRATPSVLEHFDFDQFLNNTETNSNDYFNRDNNFGMDSETQLVQSPGNSEQRRMAPVIQSSWGPHSSELPGSQGHGSATAGASLSEDKKTSRTAAGPDMHTYAEQLTLLERHKRKRVVMARQDPAEINVQSTHAAMIPGDQPSSDSDVIPRLPRSSSRPFRHRDVDRQGQDSFSVDASFNSRPILLGEESTGSSIRQPGGVADGSTEGVPHGHLGDARTQVVHLESNRQGLNPEPVREAVVPLPWNSQTGGHLASEDRNLSPHPLLHSRVTVQNNTRHLMPGSSQTTHLDSAIISPSEHSSTSESDHALVKKPLLQNVRQESLLEEGELLQVKPLQTVLQQTPRDTKLQDKSLCLLGFLTHAGLLLLGVILRLKTADVIISTVVSIFLYRQTVLETFLQISGTEVNLGNAVKCFELLKCPGSAKRLSTGLPGATSISASKSTSSSASIQGVPEAKNKKPCFSWLKSLTQGRCLI